jgi:hypothetical protein
VGPINPSVLKERLEKILVTYVLGCVTDERIVGGPYYRKFGEYEMKISGQLSKNDQKISFFEILSQIPSNHEDWYIFECDAVGKAPNNLPMSEFEDLVLNSKYGYQMSWDRLLKFSKEIEDINNLIVVSSTSPVEFETIEKGAEALQVRVEIYDSTAWEIEFYG